ncbi:MULTISPECIES: DUF4241 domain-containing protein [Actinosynnema]|uniref:DUF4241 domain-containing protein n=1 Tax=Actinosynnema TaxID=40566 RepID=UPI0020A5549F|nr:DUF4241 domain-containing protein [Actinosynnema pretiosum]MCP2096575.1 Protein of unknown function (DUF4241) [Actinosynnema pretiosum]
MGFTVGLVPCEGWDPVGRALVGGLTEEQARERDRAGQQYAVGVVDPESGNVVVLLECAGHFRRRSWFDLQGRRTRVRVEPVLDGRLFHQSTEEWEYAPEHAEFDREAPHAKVEHTPDGSRDRTSEPRGASGSRTRRQEKAPLDELFSPVPDFADWKARTGLDLTFVAHPAPAPLGDARPPWRPPAPLRPRVGELFEPGARFTTRGGGEHTIESHDAGVLRLPSGRLIAADPGARPGDRKPFELALPPGDYPVRALLAVREDAPNWKPVAALQLVVADVPATSWEMALAEGDGSVLLLGENQFYGAGVDSGQLCFVDASAAKALGEAVDERYDRDEDLDPDAAEHRTEWLTDPETGGGMVVLTSPHGDGAFPTWIGRAADGSVACLVLDTLFLPERTRGE